jgi:formate dehydrogenase iron-sulfur subunit
VKFIESDRPRGGVAWTMMSDVCKHCALASCMEVCPTNAIIRTEFDTVYIQPSVCNGCRDCIAACPYHVIGYSEKTGVAQKCTFCYGRLQANLTPACAKACPTESIKFGDLDEMRKLARARLGTLHGQGVMEAQIYGEKEYGGLHALFLLTDKPETYGMPNAQNAVLPSRNNRKGYLGSLVTAVVGVLAGVVAFRNRGARATEG